MSEKKRITKPAPISGFPEWLPEERMVEQRWLDHIRRVFESYGFCSIETPSVEALEVITAKGEVDKEIYVLERLQQEEESKKEARLALHFDQTVPFARYTAQHFNDLVFPFKRYQMQRVWRGERPQMGRMREFTQCDIDVINVDHLPLHFDGEIAAMIYEVLEGLNIGRVQLRISNRKILLGFLEDRGIEDIPAVLRILDKAEKVGKDQTFIELSKVCSPSSFGEDWTAASILISLVETKASTSQELKNILAKAKTSAATPTYFEGLEELCAVLDSLAHLPDHAVVADLSIVRGLDYYTGTVYETQLLDVPEFTGSVCSGGRYDDLASQYINKKLPGVGISIGFSRLFDVMRQTNPEKLGIGAKGPADILMTLPSDNRRALAAETARILRGRGFNVEMYHAPQKVKKQLSYAEKKGIPFVWFPPFEDGKDHEVKNMETGGQSVADPNSWRQDNHA